MKILIIVSVNNINLPIFVKQIHCDFLEERVDFQKINCIELLVYSAGTRYGYLGIRHV